MLFHCLIAIAVALALYGPVPVLAQNTEKVWALFVYTTHGDSIPNGLPHAGALTPHGADRLYAAGSAFRDRYVSFYSKDLPSNLRVQNLSPYVLRADEISVQSSADEPASSSAQAFMQGLYPPLDTSYGAPYDDLSSKLSNGSYTSYPLHGYQYPPINSFSLFDPQSIAVAGQAECLTHRALVYEYNASREAQRITRETQAFYTYLYKNTLAGSFPLSSANYANSRQISEYLDYQSTHNTTLFRVLSQSDIDRARWLADRYTFATNGNTSSTGTHGSGKARTIAGQTLASQVLYTFENNLRYQGSHEKMNLLFGNAEPAVALASLMGLASTKSANFYSRPAQGASLIFELFSRESKPFPKYPDQSDLYVRFLLRNGTSSSARFVSYPLFGHSPSNTAIRLSEFRSQMESFSLGSVSKWCLQCDSTAVFCSGLLNTAWSNRQPHGKSLDPAVAGVIGAVVTLVFLGIVTIIVCLGCGVRLRFKSKSKSSAGGFKRDGKMASDSDVTFKGPHWGDKTMETRASKNGNLPRTPLGHERSGSWEMVKRRGSSHSTSMQSSPLLEEEEEDWRAHSGLEPVRVRESV